MQNPPTSYDAVPYPSYTHPQTHPDRLAVMGSLFGLEPVCANHCRVLELGCGNGANLIPMAWSLPQSEFVGIDLAAKPIAAGNEMLRDLGLTNARLIHDSITAINDDWGNFDYIIAHGLYSWVPPEIRARLLEICRGRLAPQGIAFVSYNALPGGHLRNMLREMMLFHVRGFESAEERIKQSLAFTRFLAEAQDTEDDYRRWMKTEAMHVAEHSEGHLYHDELGDVNEPFYFTQFMEQAGRHGLQYLGEADFYEMSDHVFKDSVRQTLKQLSANRILREQYLDFLKCRRFRQTLLCRAEARLHTAPQFEKVAGLFVSSAAERVNGLDTARPGINTFASPRGAKVETDFALGQAALAILEAVWPGPLPFEDLFQQAAARLNPAAETVASNDARNSLCEFLLRLYGAGLVEFRTTSPGVAATVGERPVASPIARWQAARGDFVTSLFHLPVKVEDEIGRHLLTWLDGTRNRSVLAENVWQLLKSKNALATTESDEPALRRQVESDLEKNLVKLARFGLLVGDPAR